MKIHRIKVMTCLLMLQLAFIPFVIAGVSGQTAASGNSTSSGTDGNSVFTLRTCAQGFTGKNCSCPDINRLTTQAAHKGCVVNEKKKCSCTLPLGRINRVACFDSNSMESCCKEQKGYWVCT
jgi:hypothetical protein